MEPLDIRDGEGAERQETAEQTQAMETQAFEDRAGELVERLNVMVKEQEQDRSEGMA